jgi:DNA (cytosine-5)-methyltransferase 1
LDNNTLTIGSLFSGIGGICYGFQKAGFELKWANEIDNKACITYMHNFSHKLVEGDIHAITDPLQSLGYVDVVTAGFPCQAFSVAGNRLGFKDPRGNLFFETARIIDEIKPKAFLLENVKNLVNHDNGKTFKTIRNTVINELNYSFIPFVLNSKEYGNIPQTRERIYMVGFKDESHVSHDELLLSISNTVHGSATSRFIVPDQIPLTTKITDLLDSGEQDEKYYYRENHIYFDKLSATITKRDTVYQWRRIYVRENKSNVCPTLTANMGTGGHNVPLILDDFGIRKLTPPECARFQGFPEQFELPDNMANSHCYKQIGNAVVVPVITRIASAINRSLKAL